jgi:hypothetical protein
LLLVSPFVISRVEQLSVATSGLDMRLSNDIANAGAPKLDHRGGLGPDIRPRVRDGR